MHSGIFRASFTTEADLNALHRSLDNSCNIAKWTAYTIDEIIVACHQLKPDKNVADLVLNSSAFIHAPSEFFLAKGQLINACILHGYIHLSLLSGTIMSLLKSLVLYKSVTSSYGPIILYSLFEKNIRHFNSLQISLLVYFL